MMLLQFGCPPCMGTMLIFSVSFRFSTSASRQCLCGQFFPTQHGAEWMCHLKTIIYLLYLDCGFVNSDFVKSLMFAKLCLAAIILAEVTAHETLGLQGNKIVSLSNARIKQKA